MGTKRRMGDRKDGVLLRKIDPMHAITPLLYPNRTDNEAFITERIDLTALQPFLDEKNASSPAYKYNLFQVIVTSTLKVFTLREKMNRFIVNGNTYQRNEITSAFVVKKEFSDKGGEALAFIKASPDDTFEDIHEKIYKKVSDCRKEETTDESSKAMEIFNKMPRFVMKTLIKFICFLDRHGKVPYSLIASDPYYASVILTNLGSIKLHAGYHHLTNWGTASVFVVVGERKTRPFYDDDGSVTMKDSVDIGLTVDERIADGYYFSKTVRMLKKCIENPTLLEHPLKEEIEL